MLSLVYKLSRREHDGICKVFSAYELAAMLISLCTTYLVDFVSNEVVFVIIFVLPVFMHVLDIICCRLSCHYFRHYSIYWHVLGLTHLLYFHVDGMIEMILKRYEYEALKLALVELMYLLRIWLEYCHTIRLTPMICGTRAFSPLTNQAQWRYEMLLEYTGLMVWCPSEFAKFVVWFIALEWLQRYFVVFSISANVLVILVFSLEFQLINFMNWWLFAIYTAFSIARVIYNYLELCEKTITCLMLYNAVITGFVGPIDCRSQIEKFLSFEQNVMRYGKLVVPQYIGHDRQDAMQLANVGMRYSHKFFFSCKNRWFGRKIKFSDDLVLQRCKDENYERAVAFTDGNEQLEVFVKAYAENDDDLFEYFVCRQLLRVYCKRINNVFYALDGLCYLMLEELDITPEQRLELLEKYFEISTDKKRQTHRKIAFQYFSKPGIYGILGEYAVFLYENAKVLRQTTFYEMLYNIYQENSRNLNVDVYYKSFSNKAQSIDIERFLNVSDARLLTSFDMQHKVRYLNRVLQVCFPFTDGFCETYDERDTELNHQAEVEELMYEPRDYLFFETMCEIIRRQQIRLLDIDQCASRFECFEASVSAGIQVYKGKQSQSIASCNRVVHTNEQIIGRLFRNIEHGRISANQVKTQDFLNEQEVITEYSGANANSQEFQCVGIPSSMLNSFNVYEFQEYLFKVAHVNTSQNLIDTFVANDYQKYIAMVKGYWTYLSEIYCNNQRNMILLLGAQMMIDQYKMMMKKLMKIKRYNNDPCVVELIHQIAQRFRFDERLYRDVHYQYKMVKKQQVSLNSPHTESESTRSELTSIKPTPNAGSEPDSKNDRISCHSKNHGFGLSKSFRQLDSKLSQFFLHFKLFSGKYRKTYDTCFFVLSLLVILVYMAVMIAVLVLQEKSEASISRLVTNEFQEPYAYSSYLLQYLGNKDNFLATKQQNYEEFNALEQSESQDQTAHFLKSYVPTNAVILPFDRADYVHLTGYEQFEVEKIIDVQRNQTHFKNQSGQLLSDLFMVKEDTTYQQTLNLFGLHEVNFILKVLNNDTIYYLMLVIFAAILLEKTLISIKAVSQFFRLFEKYTQFDMQKFIAYYEKAIRTTQIESRMRAFAKISTRVNSRLVSRCHSKDTSMSNSYMESIAGNREEELDEGIHWHFCYMVTSLVVLVISVILVFRTKQIFFLQYDVNQELQIAANGIRQFTDKIQRIYMHYEDAVNLVLTGELTIMTKEDLFSNMGKDFYQLNQLPEFDMVQENRPYVGKFKPFFMPLYVFNTKSEPEDKTIQKSKLYNGTSLAKTYNRVNHQIFYYLSVALEKIAYASEISGDEEEHTYFNYSSEQDKFEYSYLRTNFTFRNSPECSDLQKSLQYDLIGSNDDDRQQTAAVLRQSAKCIIESVDFEVVVNKQQRQAERLVEDMRQYTRPDFDARIALDYYLRPQEYKNPFQQANLLGTVCTINYIMTVITLILLATLFIFGFRSFENCFANDAFVHLHYLKITLRVLFFIVMFLIVEFFVGLSVQYAFSLQRSRVMSEYVGTSKRLITYNIVNLRFLNNNYTAEDLAFGWIINGEHTSYIIDNKFSSMFDIQHYTEYRHRNSDLLNEFESRNLREEGYMKMLPYGRQNNAIRYLTTMQMYLEQARTRSSIELGKYSLPAQLYFLKYMDDFALDFALYQRKFNSINFFDVTLNFLDYTVILYVVMLLLFIVMQLYCSILTNFSANVSNTCYVPKNVFKFGMEQLGSGQAIRANELFYDFSLSWRIMIEFLPLIVIGAEVILELVVQHKYYRQNYNEMIPWNFYGDLISDVKTTLVAKDEHNSLVLSRSEHQTTHMLFQQLQLLVQGYSKYGIWSTLITPEQQVVTLERRFEMLPYVDNEYSSSIVQTQFQNFVPFMYTQNLFQEDKQALAALGSFEMLIVSENNTQKLQILNSMASLRSSVQAIVEPVIDARLICFIGTSVLLIAAVVLDYFCGFTAQISQAQKGVGWMIRSVIKSQESQLDKE